MPDVRTVFKLSVAGAVATSSRDRWVAPHAGTITTVLLGVGTAPTGATMICDLQKNGVTMYTTTANRPTIAIAASSTPARSIAPDVAAFVAGDVITLVPTQVGSGTAGSDLAATVEYVAA